MNMTKMNQVKSGAGLLSAIFITTLLFSTPAHAIKKCKDANGKWHYGDVAVQECENSKVTTLSNQGFVKGEADAPKTEEELIEEKSYRAEIEAEKERLKQVEFEKSRILSIYETEEDIDRQLENQLYAVDSNIAVHKSYIQNMEEVMAYEGKQLGKVTHPLAISKIEEKISTAQSKHDRYSKGILELEVQRKKVIEKFAKEKELYRELTKAN